MQRAPEPPIDEDVRFADLDRSARQELRTLSKDNATGVAGHLVMVARLLDSDLERAQAHADEAVRRAGRVASVREARGMVAYRVGDFQLALSEFRTARRLGGSGLLPLIVDCERGLGRPERALDMATGPEAAALTPAERAELAIVVSGIRRDLGQHEAALLALRGPELDPARRAPWSARLFYAYADALLAAGHEGEARTWFAYATDADQDLETDAPERLEEMDGVVLVDLLEGEEEDTTPDEDATAPQDVPGDHGRRPEGLDGERPIDEPIAQPHDEDAGGSQTPSVRHDDVDHEQDDNEPEHHEPEHHEPNDNDPGDDEANDNADDHDPQERGSAAHDPDSHESVGHESPENDPMQAEGPQGRDTP